MNKERRKQLEKESELLEQANSIIEDCLSEEAISSVEEAQE